MPEHAPHRMYPDQRLVHDVSGGRSSNHMVHPFTLDQERDLRMTPSGCSRQRVCMVDQGEVDEAEEGDVKLVVAGGASAEALEPTTGARDAVALALAIVVARCGSAVAGRAVRSRARAPCSGSRRLGRRGPSATPDDHIGDRAGTETRSKHEQPRPSPSCTQHCGVPVTQRAPAHPAPPCSAWTPGNLTPHYRDGRRSWAFQMRLRIGRPSPAGSTNSGR